ncbi:mannitol dehydrogenase family protein [Edaphobacter albus]|uniref:mannitol dehydrogenase family protein n=1 Tax=Edaphobacter sp. 4G125 TaxID=2763071 RepID=UPI001644BE5B|nr:mannitol dehydrogenase family protein [Edaphobacter sp. 4G125]QNI37683.1 mannitol dehydrogenase family protein [Edaphobacter sp. 4G125]
MKIADHPPITLCMENFSELSRRAQVPKYNRAELVPGIVHFGVGGFNRSHLAVYLDDLLHHPAEPRWGECGIGLLPGDLKIHQALKSQDYLYCVLTRDASTRDLRLIGSLTEHIFAPAAQEAVLQRLSAPECEIVSLTVTEGGYFIEDATRRFCTEHSDVLHDLEFPLSPRTFLGYLASAAERRMRNGGKPFTVMSCDNVQGNGEIARQALVAFATLRNDKLGAWIEANVAFPNSMVDRITPATTEEDRHSINAAFGIVDKSPVVTEPFRQWIIEDSFAGARPRFELAGAEIASDVKPYEITKMRLLNGGHSTLAYVAAVLGYTLVSDAAADPLIHRLVQTYLEETTPAVPHIAGLDLNSYKASILHRFANPTIRDQVMRICSEASAKIAKFIMPTVPELLKQQRRPRVIPFVIASWLHAIRGRDDRGNSFTIADASGHLFTEFLAQGGGNAKLALNATSVFGDIASQSTQFVNDVQQNLDRLRKDGVYAGITSVIAS